MARDLFNVPIFFIVFRETIEAAIIVSVLLSFVEQLMSTGRLSPADPSNPTHDDVSISLDVLDPHTRPSTTGQGTNQLAHEKAEAEKRTRQLIKRMRIQIWAGTLTGFVIALAIGAAFIAVFYIKLTDLWANTESLWEGVFSILACIIIYLMGVAFLKMDRSRVKWRIKLAAAFEKGQNKAIAHHFGENGEIQGEEKVEGRSGKWALFILPLITVLREGLEAIVFVGGVSLQSSAAAIPIPVIVGLICGGLVGYAIYRTGSTTTLHWFLVASTTVLFLIGAGLASKGVGLFEYYVFATGVGSDVSEAGDGPGSFRVAGNVWHVTYGNPETNAPGTNGGWQLFNAILGWNNTATLGSILSYVFYWFLIVVTLVYLKWDEGRVSFFGLKSKAAKRRDEKSLGRVYPSERHGTAGGSDAPETPMDDKDVYGGDYGEERSALPTFTLRD